MADLPQDLALKPLAPAKARGADEDKLLTGHADELKDQSAAENIIPLSPQWLYAKTGDYKAALSAAPVDTRPPNLSSQGTLLDSTPREAWRLEGAHDKKEWRKNVPDVENSRRWHDEERETGLLGRRERRKEGDRETDYRKTDRRSENVSARDTADSRGWLEVPGRNPGYESRRDIKWSSRWGPDDKEKDYRLEKRNDADKEETHVEKQSVIGGSRPYPESDSRDKWKPRHRQESGTSVYRAASGIGAERGRVEGPVVGFAPGRGRASFASSIPFSGSSSSVPLGAAPASVTGSLIGKSTSFSDTFRYPRGKILDIYRQNKVMTHFGNMGEGIVEVPQITQSTSIPPLAFVTPDSEEADVLEDIWKGKVTSGEICSDSHMGMNTKVGETVFVDCKDMINSMSNGKDPAGITSTVPKEDAFSNVPGGLNHSEEKTDQGDVIKNEEPLGNPDFLDESKYPNFNSTSQDIVTKLPEDSNSLFSTSIIHETPVSGSQHLDNPKRELAQQTVELSLFYQDPQGKVQGPFLAVDILSWYDQGFFGSDLPVRPSEAPEGTGFQSLGEVIPKLIVRSQSKPDERTEGSDTTRGNLEVSAHDSEFSVPLTLNGNQLRSSGFDIPFIQAKPRVSQPGVSSQVASFFQPGISGGIAGAEWQDFSGQDAEEVLYRGRPVHSTKITSGKLAYDMHDISRTFDDDQCLQTGQTNFTKYKIPTDNESSNPLGLSWSELEGTDHKGPLSSVTAGVGNHGHMINPLLGGDASLFRHNLGQFNNDSVVHDAWSGSRTNNSSNILDSLDAGNLSRFDPALNNLTIEEQFLSQQFQKQQHTAQHMMPSHENLQLRGSYLEQLHGPSHQEQSILHRNHMLKLQQQHQRLLQLEQEEKILQQQELHRQMQLLQQQHQQQQQRQQQQLILEQLLHHKLHDPNFRVPHADPLLRENSLDQILYRQHLMHELQQQAHHRTLEREPSLDQLIQAKLGQNLHHERHNELFDALAHPSQRHLLPLDQQYLLDLQQDQIQSRQFPIASRQPIIDEGRYVGGAWSIDESGQFISAPVSQHHARSSRPSQMDFVQKLQRTASFEQHIDHSLQLHDRIQQGNYGLNPHSFERSAGTLRSDMDRIDTFARLQGMDVQENYDRMNSLGQVGQNSGNRPQQNWMPDQLPGLPLDAMERNWSEPNENLHRKLIESQFAQLHLGAEKQNMEMQAEFPFENWSQRPSLKGNNEMPNHGPTDLLRQKLLQSSQALGLVDGTPTSTYDNRDPSWLFPQRADSLNFNVDKVGSTEVMESTFMAKLGQARQVGYADLNSEGRADTFESSRRLPHRSSSGASSELKQFFVDTFETEKYQFQHPVAGDMSRDITEFSDLKEGMKMKKHGSKIAINGNVLDSLEGGIDQAEAPVTEHDGLTSKGSVRHASFGGSGSGTAFYDYGMGPDAAYVDPFGNDRLSGISRSSDSYVPKSHVLSSQGPSSELVKGTNSASFTYSHEMGREAGGNLQVSVSETSSNKKEMMKFRRTSSYSDTDTAPEASFIDMLKGNRKQMPAETDVSAETQDAAGSGCKINKKKGKKGRQIDPSLLGFKVHSNRIMMGEIQRPE